jgi:hypothetical protein
MTKESTGAAMRDCTEMFNESGEHITTIGFNESYGLWQIVIVQRKEMECFLSQQGSRVRRLARRIRSRNWIPAIGISRWL